MSTKMTRDERRIERAILSGLDRRQFMRASGAAALAALAAGEPPPLSGVAGRHFRRAPGAAALAALAGGEPRLWADEDKIPARADSVILLWMAGGMAQTETFDPKRYTPYQSGLASNEVLSTFPAIDT